MRSPVSQLEYADRIIGCAASVRETLDAEPT